MNKYILFIDTETSDKPRKMQTPTNKVHKWPYILQVAWVVCDRDGNVILKRDYYINPGEIIISEASLKIHGITLEFLKEQGISRKEVLQKLSDDLDKYDPLIVGHFIRFDEKMLEVGFNRANIKQMINTRPKFCTMYVTRKAATNTSNRFLRLNELYKDLFNKELANQHNALDDTLATKDCFFELLKQGKVNDEEIKFQQRYFLSHRRSSLFRKISLSVLIILIFIMIYLLYKANQYQLF